jgi:hypothetical protein
MATPQTDIDLDTSSTSEPPSLFRVRTSLPVPLRNTVHSGRKLVPENRTSQDAVPLPTTVAAIDSLIAGGLPRGRLVELTGKRSSGRFSALLAALAATTRSGEAAVLVDLDDNLDPRSAKSAGVDLERLLWIRPANLKEAMISTELVLQAGFPLVALDLGTPPLRGGRGAEAHWLRLARAAEEQRAALFVSSPYRVSSTAATAVLAAQGVRPVWRRNDLAPQLLDGLDGQFSLKKSRLASKSGNTTFRFTTVEGRLLAPTRPQQKGPNLTFSPVFVARSC